ncbi:MAG: site-specific DNA-methyltransferase [Clostridium septicum]|uniref:site-specific DNA-methyltransferase n=1 Tax=Clostridium septicum TaxID=1504 RepID=UPI00258982E0|nr:site-specific DNA-methyltransferase [Clostridium septicum]MDU1315248.1 site-specific DNA-methyltransferase [Clostridium septicum]
MNQRLELTWIGKDKEVKLEPRILIEDKDKSYGDKNTSNMLIHGDNLLALKSLEQEYAGKIQCIYIDPPFNTGARINADGEEIGYDDGLEHSIWLGMMKIRLEILKKLLAEEGSILVHLDDRECAYCKIILDEVFGRNNYINTITMTTNDPSGFKATGSKIFSTSNFMLVYGKNKSKTLINKVFIKKEYDTAYSKVFTNMEDDYKKWEWTSIKELVCKEKGFQNPREAIKKLGVKVVEDWVEKYAMENAEYVFRTAAIGGGAKIKRAKTIEISKKNRDEIFVHENEDVTDFYILNGEQILFYKNRFEMIDGELTPAQAITDVWTDISWTGIAKEGNVVFKNSKKPEMLIKRVLDIFTNEGDLVLDSFLGSGTTAAVAHKMKRKWIGIELGEHCYTHCKARLENVIDGKDSGGISKLVNWESGGGFKFYELAQSLLNRDRFGNWVINKEYDAEMLSNALCKIQGFKYEPDQEIYWKQGFSNENDYIYVTTNFITVEHIDKIYSEMKENESLLICCKSYQKECEDKYDSIEIRKIPQSILDKCEFGNDSYKFNVNSVDFEEYGGDDNE